MKICYPHRSGPLYTLLSAFALEQAATLHPDLISQFLLLFFLDRTAFSLLLPSFLAKSGILLARLLTVRRLSAAVVVHWIAYMHLLVLEYLPT